MKWFAKIVKVTKSHSLFFVKHSILDVWQGSEYASVICELIVWKNWFSLIERLIQLQCKITHLKIQKKKKKKKEKTTYFV